jgi:N-glycosylase/DNA lyase
VANRWVALTPVKNGILAEAAKGPAFANWLWLRDYLQVDADLDSILRSFPPDEHITTAVRECSGLRLLKQDPWECLASFILSSTKQIVQIQQIVELLCERFGDPVAAPSGFYFGFPDAHRLAEATERDLRDCKMGFRAPYLRETAQMVAAKEIDLDRLRSLSVEEARGELMRLPGVGRKIADCVLLFAYHFLDAFPVDVWVVKALRKLYFPRRSPAPRRLLKFTQTYFGPHAGYAQQYLFHYMRTRIGRERQKE